MEIFLSNTYKLNLHNLKSSWPLLLQAKDLKKNIGLAENGKGKMPTVVKATLRTRHYSWPDNSGMGLYNSNPDYIEKRALLSRFIKDNRYSRVWENDVFEIWMPGLSN